MSDLPKLSSAFARPLCDQFSYRIFSISGTENDKPAVNVQYY